MHVPAGGHGASDFLEAASIDASHPDWMTQAGAGRDTQGENECTYKPWAIGFGDRVRVRVKARDKVRVLVHYNPGCWVRG